MRGVNARLPMNYTVGGRIVPDKDAVAKKFNNNYEIVSSATYKGLTQREVDLRASYLKSYISRLIRCEEQFITIELDSADNDTISLTENYKVKVLIRAYGIASIVLTDIPGGGTRMDFVIKAKKAYNVREGIKPLKDIKPLIPEPEREKSKRYAKKRRVKRWSKHK